MEAVLFYAWEILRSVGDVLVDASFYLLIGFVAAGVLKTFVSAERMTRHLGKANLASVLKASLIGTPLPLCSCSVIPVATTLRKNGASKGATVSFLVSTPESGVDSMAISYALLDPLMTVFRPVAALAAGVVSGTLENMLSRLPAPQPNPGRTENDVTDTRAEQNALPRRLAAGLRYAFTDLLGDVAYYLLIGLVVSGVITALLPADFFTTTLRSDWATMIAMLGVGIPLYVCASSSTPIAAALIMKGISPGAALVFLLAGPATNLATIGVVRKFLGNRSAIAYVASIGLVALAMGALLNGIYSHFGLAIHMHLMDGAPLIPGWLKTLSAAVLLPLLVIAVIREVRHRTSRK